MSSVSIKHMSRKDVIKWITTLGLTAVPLFFPVTEVYTSQIRMFFVVTIFGLALAAFEFFPILVPAVVIPTGYLICGVSDASLSFSGWTSPVTWIVLGAFLLAYTFDEIGLLKRIAYWVILRSGGTFNRTVFGLMLSGVILTFITFGNSYVIMMALAYGVCKALNLGKSTDSAIIMMGALFGAVTTRGVIYAPTNLSLMNAGAQTIVPDFSLTWIDQLRDCLPIFLLMFILYFVLIKMRKNVQAFDSKEFVQNEYRALGKMSVKEKKGLFVLALVVAYLVLAPLHKQPMDYGFMVIPWFLFLPGIDVAQVSSVKRLDFSMVFFVVGCICIGVVSGKLGIGKIVAEAVTPIIEPFGASVAMFSVFILGMVLNLFMTPLAFLAGFSGPVTEICMNLGLNPAAGLYMLNFSADAIFLPYEYVPYLIAFSFGVIPLKDFVKFNVVKFVIYCIFIFVCIFPYWKIIGLM